MVGSEKEEEGGGEEGTKVIKVETSPLLGVSLPLDNRETVSENETKLV